MRGFSGITKRVWFVLLLGLSTLSAQRETPDWLLADEDFQLEASQTRSALSSPLNEFPAWESYDEWHCFFTKDTSMGLVEHIWDSELERSAKEFSAAILVSSDRKQLEFDYEDSLFTNEDPKQILATWKYLIEGERVICLYAAYLENMGENFESWIITGIKTAKGYWPNGGVRQMTASN